MPTPRRVLRFRARGTALVQDHAAAEAGVRRYIGRKLVCVDAESGQHGFAPHDDVHEVADHPLYTQDYAAEVRAGYLWPADKETADRCGVPFDPTCGGWFPASSPSPAPSASKPVPVPASAAVKE